MIALVEVLEGAETDDRSEARLLQEAGLLGLSDHSAAARRRLPDGAGICWRCPRGGDDISHALLAIQFPDSFIRTSPSADLEGSAKFSGAGTLARQHRQCRESSGQNPGQLR
jgi:hypothetical protein